MIPETFVGNLAPVALSDAESLTTEIQVFKQGTFRKGGRTIKVGQAEIENAIKNFDAKVAGELPLDYDHSFDYGGTSEASGWYKRLYMKDGALWATVEFTQSAVEKIRAKAYRFFSPTFSADWPDESGKKHGFTLLAGALTNRPFLKNMAPITLSDQFSGEDVTEILAQFDSEFTPSERGRDMGIFKNDPTEDKATIETLTAEVTTLKAEAEKVNTLSEQVETLTSERDDLKTKLEAAESDKGAAETKVEALTERVESMEKAQFTKELNACLSENRKRGAIDATDETTAKWTTRAEKHGVEFIADLLSDIPDEAAVSLGELGHGKDRENAVHDEASRLTALDERATKIAADQSIPYAEAAVIAEKEMAS